MDETIHSEVWLQQPHRHDGTLNGKFFSRVKNNKIQKIKTTKQDHF